MIHLAIPPYPSIHTLITFHSSQYLLKTFLFPFPPIRRILLLSRVSFFILPNFFRCFFFITPKLLFSPLFPLNFVFRFLVCHSNFIHFFPKIIWVTVSLLLVFKKNFILRCTLFFLQCWIALLDFLLFSFLFF